MTQIAEADWKLISDLIQEQFGLSFDGARRDILEGRLRNRLSTLHLQSFREYYHFLRFHPGRDAEHAELTRRITNNETYFFREPGHYAVVLKHILPPLLPALRSRPFRVLSAGCSSGEEAYSLVVHLVDNGLELQGYSWEIDACDLNPARIDQAREAVYEPLSLRGCNEETRRHCFVETEGRFRLKDRYRKGVNFFTANLASSVTGLGWGTYDAVFCRNMLIYFSDEAFLATIGLFSRLVAPGGYLLLGHSESLIDRVPEFEPVFLEGAMAYRRVESHR
jgi:chemotaxis protein methyltransferase CheR